MFGDVLADRSASADYNFFSSVIDEKGKEKSVRGKKRTKWTVLLANSPSDFEGRILGKNPRERVGSRALTTR